MITIEYHRNSGATIGGIPMRLGAAEYARGILNPNYPMPSIVTEASLWRNCYMLFKDNDTEPFKMWIGN